MIALRDLALRRGGRVLLSGTSLTVHPGWRVGVTGANGVGKSSLMALVTGALAADEGAIELPPAWRVAHVEQEMAAGEQGARDYVIDGDGELRAAQASLDRAEAAGDGEAIAHAHARLEAIDGYSAPHRAARLLHGLGFAEEVLARSVRDFSGGWRMRLRLARALMTRSDLLLLDEPTNHLDLDAVLWLEDWLQTYPGTLLLISHDRDFLDRVVDHVLHIEHGRARLYTGDYSRFEALRAEDLARDQAVHRRQQREVAHIRTFVERFRAKATKARQAQSRLKALERMALASPAHVDSPFHFAFPAPERLPRSLLGLEGVSAGYPGTPVLEGVDLDLLPGDRVGLLGPNGAGKSTLVRVLAGELAALAGEARRAADLRVGYFAQHQLEQLDGERTPLAHLLAQDPGQPEQGLRDFLGGFGFTAERVLEPVRTFSGGERARLVLALLVSRRPNLLLLDEPTNHLDLEMRRSLMAALADYPGAVVLVSHDRHLLRGSVDRFVLVHGGGVEPFDGDLDDYRRWLRERLVGLGERGSRPPLEHGARARRDRRREAAAQRRRLQPLRDQVRRLEADLDHLHAAQGELEARLAEPALYERGEKARLMELLGERRRIQASLTETEEAWLGASEELEGLEERSSV